MGFDADYAGSFHYADYLLFDFIFRCFDFRGHAAGDYFSASSRCCRPFHFLSFRQRMIIISLRRAFLSLFLHFFDDVEGLRGFFDDDYFLFDVISSYFFSLHFAFLHYFSLSFFLLICRLNIDVADYFIFVATFFIDLSHFFRQIISSIFVGASMRLSFLDYFLIIFWLLCRVSSFDGHFSSMKYFDFDYFFAFLRLSLKMMSLPVIFHFLCR